MNHKTIEDYILTMPGASLDYPFGEGVGVYKVAGKMFALIRENANPLQVNLKCDPQLSEDLRARYVTVLPGHHMSKKHWITIILSGELPDDDIFGFVQHSYLLVVDGLTKEESASLTA